MIIQSYAKQETEKFQRDLLASLLGQCNPEQQELFHKLYPGKNGPRTDQLICAIDQCHNTLVKNRKKEENHG